MKKFVIFLSLVLMSLTSHAMTGMIWRLADSKMKGDVNGDRVINITDVMMIVEYILGHPNNEFIASNADFDRDGNINITDGMLIVDYILGKIDDYPPLDDTDPSIPNSHSEHTGEVLVNSATTASF